MLEFVFFPLGLLCALSVPLFYIWGVVAFIRTIANNDKPTDRPTTENDLLQQLRRSALQDRDLSVSNFLVQQGVPGPWMYKQNEPSPTDAAPDDHGDDVADAAPEVSAKEKRTPDAPPVTSSEQNRFGNSAINLLSFLGTFLIVASVALFVGVGWQTFSPPVRFALVLLFTLGWFTGGVIMQQAFGLANVSLAFITTGAILTPFVGVAFQLYIVDNPAGVGPVWMITSLVVTVLYLGLSWFYRRRYFTYFGMLSTLAMVLSLVEIGNAPTEYYILTATATALLLLLVRIGLRFVPDDYREYYAQDIENSSVGTLLVSVGLGLLAAIGDNIAFYSVEVLAVLFLTVVYAWVYVTLRLMTFTLAAAQVLTLFLVDHALVTFGIAEVPRLLLDGSVHLGLLVALNIWLVQREDPTLYHRMNMVALALTGGLYIWSTLLDPYLIPVGFAVGLAVHAAYVAAIHKKPWLYHLTALMAYPVAIHMLTAFETGLWAEIWTYITLGAIQVGLAYVPPIPPAARQASVRVGLVALGVAGAVGTTLLTEPSRNAGIVAVHIVGLIYIIFGLREHQTPQRIISPIWHVLTAGAATIFYLISLGLRFSDGDISVFVSAGLAMVAGATFIVAYLNIGLSVLVVPITVAPYAVLTHILGGFDAPQTVYPVALSALSLGIYALRLPGLPSPANTLRRLVVLTAQVGVAGLAMAASVIDFNGPLYLTGWVAGYTLLGLVWFERDLYSAIIRDYVIALVAWGQYSWHMLYVSVYLEIAPFRDIQWFTGAAVAILFLLAYRANSRDENGAAQATALEVLAGLIAFMPILGQITSSGDLIYLLVGVGYALTFVGGGIAWERVLQRRIGTVGLVAVVLLQTRDAFFGIPRFLVVLIIGFGLIGAAVYLAFRQQRRQEHEAE